MYRAPDSDRKLFKNEYENVIKKGVVSEKKQLFVIDDININSLDYEYNNIVNNFLNALFKNSMFPVITRPPRVTRHSSTVIDHILTNAILTKSNSSGIVKTDISDHFPIFSYIDEEIFFDRKR